MATTFDKWNLRLGQTSLSPWKLTDGHPRQIAVLMSGGVDSSVAAHLLKDQGWDVLGVTMNIPVSCNLSPRGCCGADAALVCCDIGIAHCFVDVAEAFEELVIKRFRQAYAEGRTPNPCVLCNRTVKLGEFHEPSLVYLFRSDSERTQESRRTARDVKSIS